VNIQTHKQCNACGRILNTEAFVMRKSFLHSKEQIEIETPWCQSCRRKFVAHTEKELARMTEEICSQLPTCVHSMEEVNERRLEKQGCVAPVKEWQVCKLIVELTREEYLEEEPKPFSSLQDKKGN
jgi:hypothetical protein